MIKFTLLTDNQIFDEKINLIKEYGTKCELTDFSILLGALSDIDNDYKSNTYGNNLGYWLTKSFSPFTNWVCVVSDKGTKGWGVPTMRGYTPRIAFKLSDLNIDVNTNKDVFEIEYGEYPQTALPLKKSNSLEQSYKEDDGYLKRTGKFYTFDRTNYPYENKKFESRIYNEYIDVLGNKYIRFVVDYNSMDEQLQSYKLSSELLKFGEVIWIKVEPIKWIVDKKANIVLLKKGILSGIRLDSNKEYYGDFENSEMYEYINTYFSKEMLRNNETYSEKVKQKRRPIL